MEIVTSFSKTELEAIITASVQKALNVKPALPVIEKPDRCGITEACEITGLKKNTIYRKSFDNSIPCEKYGKFLIFSRRQLSAWVASETTPKRSPETVAADHLQTVANRK